MSEAEPQGFWDVFKRFQTAAAAGEQQTAREYLDKAASFPAADAVPALTERARLRFIDGDIAACRADVELGIGALQDTPLARWFRKDLAYMGALCRYAMHLDGADELLPLIPADDPKFNERPLQGPTMAQLEAGASRDSDLLIERYLALKHRLRRNAVNWPSLLESLTADDIVLQIGAMDGVKWDPLHDTITRLDSRGVLVEPIAEQFEKLRHNYAANTRLILANVAIAEQSGPQIIYRVPLDKVDTVPWADGISTLRKPNPESVIAPLVVPETVRGLTFADFCNEFDVMRFDLLQIDTEGYDWNVLRQIDLARFATRIVRLEYCHVPLDVRIHIADYLEAAGFDASCDDDFDMWAVRR